MQKTTSAISPNLFDVSTRSQWLLNDEDTKDEFVSNCREHSSRRGKANMTCEHAMKFVNDTIMPKRFKQFSDDHKEVDEASAKSSFRKMYGIAADGISAETARNWLMRCDFVLKDKKKNIYVDGNNSNTMSRD